MAVSRSSVATAALGLALFAAGCSHPQNTRSEKATLGVAAARLYVVPSTLWPNPSAIPVCWETSGFTKEKGWVKAGIESSWEKAAPHIHFTGWDSCEGETEGIRIAVVTGGEGPHVKELGAQGAGLAQGMVLDLALDPSDPYYDACHASASKNERCIKSIANHEFGHALGFLHEQQRPDTPSSCQQDESEGDAKELGEWDLMSIMNYCFPDRDNAWPLSLSPGDIEGLLEMYPAPDATRSAASGDHDHDHDGHADHDADAHGTGTGAGDDDDDDDSTPNRASRPRGATLPSSGGCSAGRANAPTSSEASALVVLVLGVLVQRRRTGTRGGRALRTSGPRRCRT